ncbi:DUF397 domain-containing protein [Solwaraspora sp. WMMD1047]|uniref:DUF397 domain-containing protein n=1 Tax=Solwaraspora sp. WMMD1047 TaxID=3016102 RepID=UPI0024177C26|nr:DUF397 domain-containing protein [Solwaraspora sp. WMMD1047]MDG4830909.1 DUF397 domain-containing protein [Solwaraspora sp. WMMD1047]
MTALPTPDRDWFKSSRSATNAACVEVRVTADLVGVRDSKNPDGPALAFAPAAWAGFIGVLSAGAQDPAHP